MHMTEERRLELLDKYTKAFTSALEDYERHGFRDTRHTICADYGSMIAGLVAMAPPVVVTHATRIHVPPGAALENIGDLATVRPVEKPADTPAEACGWCADGWPTFTYNGKVMHSVPEPMAQVPCERPEG